MSEIKITLDRIDSRLDTAGEMVSKRKDREIKTVQNETQRGKAGTAVSYRMTASSLTHVSVQSPKEEEQTK